MRLVFTICVSMAFSQVGSSQATVDNSETMIKKFLSSGVYYGQIAKQVRKSGDAAAVSLTKLFGESDLDSAKISTALIVLRDAFSDLPSIEVDADRVPRTTLLLLRYLDGAGRDPRIKKEIAAARKAVLDESAPSVPK